ncbi:MAG: hypothetical protein AAF411_30610 [Myxococcota bacterium]
MRRLWLLVATALIACGSEASPAVEEVVAQLTTTGWPPAMPGAPAGDAPIDPRDILLQPEAYIGQERLCDVSFLGEPAELADGGERRLVRCVGETGAGWADLAFAAEARSLREFVRVGERIRVRVEEGPGFEGHPRVAFVAHVSAAEGAVETPAPAPPIGSDWAAIAARGDENVHRCAVSWVGSVRRLENGEYSHGGRVSCRSRFAETWAKLVFPEVTHRSSLRLRRGEVIPARLVGFEDGLPVLRYEGP